MTPPRPLGFWLKLVDELINRQFEETLGEQGVTRRQWQVLNLLATNSATGTELGEALAPFLLSDEPDRLTEELGQLRARGWVRQQGEVLSLTEQGRTSFQHLAETVARSRGVVAEGITADEYEQTLRVLERMARNLGWTGPDVAR